MMRRSKRVLVAGATGYLGRHLLRAFSDAGYSVRALARSPDKLIGLEPWVDEVFVGEATDPSTLTGLCEGLDIVVSALGITRQSDGLTYDDVDYRANRHLLDAALEAGVGHFTYIHLLIFKSKLSFFRICLPPHIFAVLSVIGSVLKASIVIRLIII